ISYPAWRMSGRDPPRRRALLPRFPDGRSLPACPRSPVVFDQAGRRAGVRNFSMLRLAFLSGAGTLVLGAMLATDPSPARGQTALPPVTVDAPREARAKPARPKPVRRTVAVRPRTTPPTTTAIPTVLVQRDVTPSIARDGLNQAPSGQTQTTLDRSQFDNRPAFSVGDVLRESPGISIKQGNGPRDVGISIRGSNARNGFGIRNLVIFEDGFPV